MSGLARILLEMGVRVSGSDRVESPAMRDLRGLGADLYLEEDAANLPADCGVLIHSAAIPETNPERAAAAMRGVPQIKYASALGMLTTLRKTLAVAGTHGKTSTTNMIASVFVDAGRSPGWVVGGQPRNLPASARWGQGDEFIVEACEYDHSFLNLSPWIGLIHNIEPDHMDCFGNFDNLKQAFRDFAKRVHPQGAVIANGDDEAVRECLAGLDQRIIWYGLNAGNTLRATNLDLNGARPSFTLCLEGEELCRISLGLPGRVNILNALAAASVAHVQGIAPNRIAPALGMVQGVRRRFELLGTWKGIPVIDDYAHHPTAVAELVDAARRTYPGRHITFVFQAHQYARLIGFFDLFKEGLSKLDEVVVCRTYAAREKGIVPGEPEGKLAAALRDAGVAAIDVASFDAAIDYLSESQVDGRVIFTVGAGDVTEIAHRLCPPAESAATDLRSSRTVAVA